MHSSWTAGSWAAGVLAGVLLISGCHGLPPAAAPVAGQTVAEMIGAQCPKFASQMVDRKEVQLILKERPVDIPLLCACTERGFARDERLREVLAVDHGVLVQKLRNPQLQSYMTLRLMTSFLECVAPEFDKALKAAVPTP